MNMMQFNVSLRDLKAMARRDGKMEGIAEGKAEGIVEGFVETAKSMKNA